MRLTGLLVLGIWKYAERKLADAQMEEIRSLADLIVKNSKNKKSKNFWRM